MKKLHVVISTIEAIKARSAWDRGVKAYALDLLADLDEAVEGGWIYEDDLCNHNMSEKALLNGASSWTEFSYGGCSLIYNIDVAKRLCTPSEYKKVTSKGESHFELKAPNAREEWLDVQARALYQACSMICKAFNR